MGKNHQPKSNVLDHPRNILFFRWNHNSEILSIRFGLNVTETLFSFKRHPRRRPKISCLRIKWFKHIYKFSNHLWYRLSHDRYRRLRSRLRLVFYLPRSPRRICCVRVQGKTKLFLPVIFIVIIVCRAVPVLYGDFLDLNSLLQSTRWVGQIPSLPLAACRRCCCRQDGAENGRIVVSSGTHALMCHLRHLQPHWQVLCRELTVPHGGDAQNGPSGQGLVSRELTCILSIVVMQMVLKMRRCPPAQRRAAVVGRRQRNTITAVFGTSAVHSPGRTSWHFYDSPVVAFESIRSSPSTTQRVGCRLVLGKQSEQVQRLEIQFAQQGRGGEERENMLRKYCNKSQRRRWTPIFQPSEL